jgi:hypothetical protein
MKEPSIENLDFRLFRISGELRPPSFLTKPLAVSTISDE